MPSMMPSVVTLSSRIDIRAGATWGLTLKGTALEGALWFPASRRQLHMHCHKFLQGGMTALHVNCPTTAANKRASDREDTMR